MGDVPAYMYTQSGVIPYRFAGGGVEVLLVTTRSGKRWTIPKGVVEPALSPLDSAMKEAFEEAGVQGRATDEALGRYRYRKWGGTCTVEVFAFEVEQELEDWPERGARRREWVAADEAADRMREQELRELIVAFAGTHPPV